MPDSALGRPADRGPRRGTHGGTREGSVAPTTPGSSRSGWGRGWGGANVVLAVLATALLVGAVLVWARPATGGTGDPAARALSRQQWEVTEAAGAEVEAFLSVDHRAMDEVVARVERGATGDFAEEYADGRDELVRSTRASRAVSTAVVRAVALGEVTTERADVLVAADARVTNRDSGDEAQLRRHRLRLELVQRDDRWLVERLEFVQ